MHYRKATFCVIIVLLVFFLPITIFSTTKAIQKAMYVENPLHEFKFENKLYFYDGEQLLGTYPCHNFPNVCEYATFTVPTPYEYQLREYIPENTTPVGVINKRYAFLVDTTMDKITNALITLYDLQEGSELSKYKEIKDYGTLLNNNLFIVKGLTDKYGVISLNEKVNLNIPLDYEYIGLVELYDENGLLNADRFVTYRNGLWQIIGSDNSAMSDSFSEAIITYNKTYLVLKNENQDMYIIIMGIGF